MLRELVLFEWRYHTRQMTFAAGALLFFGAGFVLAATGFGPRNLAINSPFVVTQSLAFVSLLSVFAAGVFASSAVLRDSEHRMEEIVYGTPVTRVHFLSSRFLGAFLAASTAAAFSVAGLLVGTVMPWVDGSRVAPFDAVPYLRAFAALTLPNVLVATALLLTIAVLTRNALATYAGSVVLYVLYFVVAALTDSPLMAGSRPGVSPGQLVSVLDPFGLTAFFDLTRYWTAAAKNSRQIPIEGLLLANRLIWIGVASLLALVVYHRFSFRMRRVRRGRPLDAVVVEPSAASPPDVRPRLPVRPSLLASYGSAARMELRVLRSAPVLLLLAVWAALAGSEIQAQIGSGEFGTRMIPATTLVIEAVQTPLLLVGWILLTYYGAEMFWRERRHGIDAILAATPVESIAMIAAKWSGMAGLIVAIVAIAIVPGVVLQAAAGHMSFEPLLYLSLFYFAGAPLLLFGTAVLFVQALSPGKYAGLILALALAFFTQMAPSAGLDHRLWRFAVPPPVRHSDMNGFGHDPVAFHWFLAHWTALCVCMLLVAAAGWRSLGAPVRERLAIAVRRHGRALSVAVAAAVLTGGWILYNTNVLQDRSSADELDDWKSSYEKRYASLAARPQPRIEAITASVDLFPGERRYRVTGEYLLRNVSPGPIAEVIVSTRREAESVALTIAGARATRDEAFGMTRFALPAALAPGATTTLHFDLAFAEQGFSDGPSDDSIARNGSFLMSFRCFPGIGYRKGYELRDRRERRERGLPESSGAPDVAEGPSDGAKLERVALDLTIGTAGDQIAVAPGQLVRSWQEKGRARFRYRTTSPVFNRFAIASARYDVARVRQGGLEIELYHHPGHEANAQRVLEAAAAAVEYCQTNFGPYPGRQLRLAEIPSYWPFGAFAMPETIFLVENRTMLVDGGDVTRVDLIARRVVHEVAHQWWGHTLAPADGPGATVLVESLTKYTELMVVERMRGPQQTAMILEAELDRYLAGRAEETDAEPQLAQAMSQDYLYYSKGALALASIRDRAGESRVNAALRDLLARYRERGGVATSLDLVTRLHDAAGEEQQALVDEWFHQIVLYDFRIAAAQSVRRPDGLYDVILEVEGSRRIADGNGNEKAAPLDAPVDIAIHAAGEAKPLALETARLRYGSNTVTLTVPEPPAFAVVDPRFHYIDTTRSNNEKRL